MNWFLCSNQKISCVRIRRFLVFESRDFLCSNQEISCVRIRRFLVIESRDFLCSNQEISCVRTKTSRVFQSRHVLVPTEDMCWRTVRDRMGWNFGRTDLRISASKAKFDARADGAVRLAVRRPKPRKIREKKFSDPRISRKKNFAPNLFLRAPNFFLEIFPPPKYKFLVRILQLN